MTVSLLQYNWAPFAIPVGVTALLILFFGVVMLIRRVTRVTVAFFLFTLSSAIWLLARTMVIASPTPEIALGWSHLAYLGVPFVAPSVYFFTLELLRIPVRRRPLLIVGWCIGFFFCWLGFFTERLVLGMTQYRWGYNSKYNGAAGLALMLFFGFYLCSALLELARAWKQTRDRDRSRLKVLIAGFLVAYFAFVDFLPSYEIGVYPFGYLCVLAFVLIIARTVWKYDLIFITPSLAAREIISTMADALFVCDREGRIQVVNSAAETLLGYERHELIGKPAASFIELRDGGEDLESVLSQRAVDVEYVMTAKNGERIHVTLSIAPIEQEGDLAGAVIIARDVREWKRAEGEVVRAMSLLQSTLDSTADGILVVSGDREILSYNERFIDMWGVPKAIMEAEDDRQIVEWMRSQVSERDEFERVIDDLYTKARAESYGVLEFHDGRLFERYSIGREIEGVSMARIWSFRDVTARHAAEAALRESETRYRLLFEQNAAGVCLCKPEGTILDCNQTFASIVGYQRAELIGSDIGELYVHPVERDELARMLRDVPALNSVEIELRRKNGTNVWVIQNLAMVVQGDSAVVHSTVVDISDRKRAEEQIAFHAYHDVLTQLPNRRLFNDRLRQSLTHVKRSGKSLAVISIDLDHFKSINDTLGHTGGDEMLLEMSHRLRNCVRDDDTVARLGGDEFTIVLSEMRVPEDAMAIAEKILTAVQVPVEIGGLPIEVTASVGIALYPGDGAEPETLLRNADSALHRAKDAGRNNYQLCTDEMKRRAVERLSLETRLRRALQDGQLMLKYQPQVNLASGDVIGAEALVRWTDPDHGEVDPALFIAIAEESRLILPLGEWVLRTACRQTKEWHDRGNKMRVSVNLSARQFQQHDLVDMVARILEETGLAPSALELEITESAAMQNGDQTVEILRALRKIGVGISIDDFGTGYSSLNYLKRFPINAVKIDRGFVRDIAHDDGDAAIVSAVIGIARSLRLRVVAEGVETIEQLDFLQKRECDEAQGYLFSRPIPPEELTAALMKSMREPRVVM